jgi:hypothetical protein
MFIKDDLWMLINRLLTSGNIGKVFNKSLITLLPKSANPRKVRDFRPISLLVGYTKLWPRFVRTSFRELRDFKPREIAANGSVL